MVGYQIGINRGGSDVLDLDIHAQFAAFDRNGAGTDELEDAIGLEQFLQGLDLAVMAGQLDGEGIRRNINDMATENVSDLQDLTAVFGIATDFDKDQFTGEMIGRCQMPDNQDIGSLWSCLVIWSTRRWSPSTVMEIREIAGF